MTGSPAFFSILIYAYLYCSNSFIPISYMLLGSAALSAFLNQTDAGTGGQINPEAGSFTAGSGSGIGHWNRNSAEASEAFVIR